MTEALPGLDTTPAIGPLLQHELGGAVEVLARAFRDNPLNVAVIGDDPVRRLRSNRHGMRALLPVAMQHAEVLAGRTGDRARGFLITSPPRAHPLPAPSLLARLRCLIGQGPRVVRRWEEVFVRLSLEHPNLPHWYVGTLGVAPEAQGTGTGGTLLAALLRRADAEGSPVYLETDRRENVAFYERRGFRVEGELELLGVPVWRMWRPSDPE